jgi:rfaE bifunctional protein kinase chain/domain
MRDFNHLFEAFSKMHVGIIGDVMLDTYWWGSVDRISPEAPVPIVAVKKRDYRIGGAGNVALNTVALGAQTSLISVIGNDDDATILKSLLEKNNISTNYIVSSNDRVTTNKIRIIARNQQMMRLDAEITKEINAEEEDLLISSFNEALRNSRLDVVVFEDYNKGVLTPRIIEEIIRICNDKNIITTVDPKRKNFFCYKGVTIFKPNLSEVKDALHLLPEEATVEALPNVHLQLKDKLQHSISLITLSEKGVFFNEHGTSHIIPSHVRNIADVSGAGDTVIAVASLAYATTKDIHLSSAIANIAGGLVCEEVGTVAINKEKLLQECAELLAEKV